MAKTARNAAARNPRPAENREATTNARRNEERVSEENSTAANEATNAQRSGEGASEENSTAANAAENTNLGPRAARRAGGRGRRGQSSLNSQIQGGKTPRRRPTEGRRVRRRRKMRPGEGALKEIRKMQNSTDLLIAKASIARLIREITQSITPKGEQGFRFTSTAIAALHEAAEAHAVKTFEMSMLAAIHAKRVTLMPKDMQFVRHIREEN